MFLDSSSTSFRISARRTASYAGKVVKVLCDGASRTDPDTLTGRTAGNISVFFAGDPALTGQFVSVRIGRTEPFALYGTIEK